MAELDNKYEDGEKEEQIDIVKPSPAEEFKTVGDSVLRWFTTFSKFLKRNGYKHIYGTLVVLLSAFLLYDIALGIHRQKVVDTIIKTEVDKLTKHDKGTKLRVENSPKIQHLMTKVLYEFSATRVLLLEFHNGKENGGGLPFIYGDVTIEETNSDEQISTYYQDINLSNFTMPTYLYKNRYFFGTINEFKAVDRKLGMKLESDGVKYAIGVLLRTTEDIGILFITYDYIPVIDEKAMYPKTFSYANDIANLLDYDISAKKKDEKEGENWW